MKIVAIRGQNLASLAGQFAVEFEAGPLSSVGLYAITGPTGAGKSTLLDALCLALFDRTPRLCARGGVPIGHANEDETLKLCANDVRSLLRRGTSRGYAEVEFIGRDAHRYRARWTVRRARGRATGRMQAQTLELQDVDNQQSLTGTKSETLAAIEDRLGLSFDQFRRSALLAQGEFAAFLRAPAADRAALLERMTGTEIYGAVSRVAYRRAMAETRELAGLLDREQALAVLESDERVAIERARDKASVELANAMSTLRAAEREVVWHETSQELMRTLRDADSEYQERSKRWRNAQAAQRYLVKVETMQTHGPAFVELDRCLEAVAAATHQRELRQGQVEAAVRKRECARSECQTSKDERDRLSAALSWELSRQLAREHQRARSASQWLADNASLEPIAAQWPRWRKALTRLGRAQNRVRTNGQERPGLLTTAERARQELQRAQSQYRTARERFEGAKAASQQARVASDAQPLAAATATTAAVCQRHDQLCTLQTMASEARALLRERSEQGDLAKQARAAVGRYEAEIATATAALELARALVTEAESTLDRMRLAEELATHRGELKDGEECPLCGAVEHPFARDSQAASNMLVGQRSRVVTLRSRVTAQMDARAKVCGLRDVAVHDAASAVERERKLTEALTGITARWTTQLRQLGELALHGEPQSEAVRQWLESTIAATEARIEGAQAAQRAAETLHTEAIQAESIAFARRNELDDCTVRVGECERATSAAERRLDQADEARRVSMVTVTEQLEELAPIFTSDSAWRDLDACDMNAFIDRQAESVAEWQRKSVEREQATHRAAELSARRSGSGLGEPDPDEVDLVWFAEQFGHEPDVLGALGTRLKTNEKRLETTGTLAQTLAETAAAAEAQLSAANEAYQQLASELSAAQQRVGKAARRAGETIEALRALVEIAPEWLVTERQRLNGLKNQVDEAHVVAQERQRARDAHDAAYPAAERRSHEATVAQCDANRLDVTKLQQMHATAVARLAADDAAHAKRAEVSQSVERQRERASTYKALGELIGSASGRKLRIFAQSLTLDTLLANANTHLSELANRYRLVRVPGHDLDLQVIDCDMGNEVRAVNSLSGGECFLVSLALALGLAQLSARDVAVETLLIDEGFGTLDPANLEVALSVLDALQASGRKVGLISHVPGLAERVGARVAVRPVGAGRSRVEVLDAC